MPTSESNPSPNGNHLQEEEDEALTDECKQLLLSLPKDKAWVRTNLYQYMGFWHLPKHLQGVLACRSSFRALPSDILLVTAPKSGTTWLKALLFALVNRHLHPIVNIRAPPNLLHPLTTHNPHELVPFLEIDLFANNVVPDLSTLPSPRLFATHLPVSSLPNSIPDSACKIVYLCRDPRDAFISLWHFTNKLRDPKDGALPLEEALDRFCRGVSIYGPFWDHVLGYWNESRQTPTRVMFLKYEEMKSDPTSCVRRLAEFLECPFSLEEDEGGVVDRILDLCSFDNLSNLEVNTNGKLDSGDEIMKNAYFRRGQVGDWANNLTPKMVERLDKISEEKLHGSGLKF